MRTLRRGMILLLTMLLSITFLGTGAALSEQSTVELPYFLNQFEGTALDLRQYWGKAYLLFFFTESSEACAKQLPELKRIYESYSSDDLQIVLIHEWADETDLNTMSVVDRFGLQGMTIFEDTDMAVARKINIPGCPMTIFMNDGGYLFDAFVYGVPYDTMAEILDVMGVSRGSPATPAPATPIPAETDLPPAVSQPSATPQANSDESGTGSEGGVPFGAIGEIGGN